MSVRQWKRVLAAINLGLVVAVAAAFAWVALDAPAVAALPVYELAHGQTADPVGDPRDLEAAITGAPLQPVEQIVSRPPPPPPPQVDEEQLWIDRAVRVTGIVPRAAVCTIARDGERPIDGDLWFTGQRRQLRANGRSATLELESIDEKRGVAVFRWLEAKRRFELAAARNPGSRPSRPPPPVPDDPPEEPLDPPDEPPRED